MRAVGAYFDFGYDNAQATGCHNFGKTFDTSCSTLSFSTLPSTEIARVSPSFDLRISPSTYWSAGTLESFKVIVENTGTNPWPGDVYLRSETSHSVARLATEVPGTEANAWLPLGIDRKITVPHVLPGQFTELSTSHSVARLATEVPGTEANAWLPLGIDRKITVPHVLPGQFTELSVKVNEPPADLLTAFMGPIVGALSFCLSSGEVFGETLYCTAIPDTSNHTWVFRRGVPEAAESIDSDAPMDEV
ncbi:hypothetical protein P879_05027 [Paragonimus westermani]|uniref:Uncharacterized protein n=1 Tax=Paragonimus westermani TaxID=34504 RepID=A0A8T0DD41_9TREM|nr:hypothetical protein P879_05027 [Paragonimus westermani]